MTVLLTHGYFLEDDPKEQQIMRPYAPLGLLYIDAFLEKNGIASTVFDTTFTSKVEFYRHVFTMNPTIIAIYVNLMTKINVLEMVHKIKMHCPQSKVVLGGPEVTHSAENFLRHGADYIVIGEGEETMLELTRYILKSDAGETIPRTPDGLPGIAFLQDDHFVQTTPRSQVRDLNTFPIPNRHKINLFQYLEAWKRRHGQNSISVSTMRGCPYTCKWCSRAVYGLSYRRRDPLKVVEELVTLNRDYQPDAYWFVDDVFTISHKWLAAFRDALKEQKVTIRYECITRSDRMNEEIIEMLKETGCFRVWIGAESGSQKVIDLMDRRVDVGQVKEMIRLTRKFQIEAGTFIMLGYPGETEDDIEETITHLKESDPDYFTITVAYPIKGTELYQEVEALRTESLDWATSTDRNIDFKRTYSRRYYDFAVVRVTNEVNAYKSAAQKRYLNTARFKLKSTVAKVGMWWTRAERQ